MRKALQLVAILALLASAAGTRPGVLLRASSPSWTSSDKLVAAYYFYWYDIYTGRHFVDPDGSDALTDHPPSASLATYSYKNVAWHRQELLDMLAAKIDIVLPVYWGSTAEAVWANPGLINFVAAWQGLAAEGQAPPKVGLFYDTSALQQQNGNLPPDLTTAAGKALFYGMAKSFFDRVPAGLWALIDGRPVVYLYGASFVSRYDQSTFDYLNQHFVADFGVRPYLIRETSWQGIAADGAYPWGVALTGPRINGRVGTLGPGFDDTAVYGRSDPRIRERACGAFYNTGWDAMINGGARLVSLETWNELHEATDIAASLEYGRTYIDLTAQNVQRWKANDFTAAPLVWLELGRYPYAQGLLPGDNAGDGQWLTTVLTGREAAYPNPASSPASYYIYLDVSNDFIYQVASEVWVTVEYWDGSGRWQLQYDAAGSPYAEAGLVTLANSGRWQRQTFHLTDAYFGGRENGGADLRLSSVAWTDSQTDYFSRVWISRSAPGNTAPGLAAAQAVSVRAGQVLTVPVAASDPDGQHLTLSLDAGPTFASLTDNGNGTGSVRLAPELADAAACPIVTVRVLATDSGSPRLADAATIEVRLAPNRVFLPVVRR